MSTTNQTRAPQARMVPLTATSSPSLYAALDDPCGVRLIETLLSDDAPEADPNRPVVRD